MAPDLASTPCRVRCRSSRDTVVGVRTPITTSKLLCSPLKGALSILCAPFSCASVCAMRLRVQQYDAKLRHDLNPVPAMLRRGVGCGMVSMHPA